jgi:hypothetical protein
LRNKEEGNNYSNKNIKEENKKKEEENKKREK